MQDPHLEVSRLQALHALEIISSGSDPAMDQICALASDMFDLPMAAVTLLDEEHQWLKAQFGFEVQSFPRNQAFCNHTILGSEVLVVTDASQDARFVTHPHVTGTPHIRFYAGAPLEIEPGIRLGALCVVGHEPRAFSAADQHRLAQLAMLVVSQIRLHVAALEVGRKTAEIELRQSDLLWSASHDALTGLPSRTLFQDNLKKSVASVERGIGGGLMIVDIDGFRRINETLGYEAGDTLLIEVSQRLSNLVQAPDLIARLGSDEFAILVNGNPDGGRLNGIASRVNETLRTQISYNGHVFPCSASIGQALMPEHGRSTTEIFRSADLALRAAKEEGRDRAVMYRTEFRDRLKSNVTMLNRARDALSRDAIIPFYQPKISLRTGQIVGFEALLRWQDPQGVVQPPSTIWAAFSDPILSIELGRRMLDRVLADMATWSAAGVSFGAVAINVSLAEFSQGDLAAGILKNLAAHGLAANMLEIEVTESVFLDGETGNIAEALHALNDAGICTALDDFGTGYASLTHLRKFPVQWLKIDRSFVGDMHENRESAAIVNTIVELAQSLRIGVVAEGIETIEQLRMLTKWNCDVGQGYLFSKPIEPTLIPAFLAKSTGRPALV